MHFNISKIKQLLVFAFFLLLACSSKKTDKKDEPVERKPAASPSPAVEATQTAPFEVSKEKPSLESYYEQDEMKEYYPQRILPPAFDFNVDLSDKSPVQLWLLRNEIFARNGYLFEDAVLRGYFDQFKWYQPIFDTPGFKVQLDSQEAAFVNKVLTMENEKAKDRYVSQGDFQMINFSHVYNTIQFKEINDSLRDALARNNFAIVPGETEQLFYVYDNNHYQYIPNFITTDLYLQILHKYFSSILKNVEEEKFIPLLTRLLKSVYTHAYAFGETSTEPELRSAAHWTTTYLAIANSLISGQKFKVDPEMLPYYNTELAKIRAARGEGSDFLGLSVFQYSQFKPRGNYTSSEALKGYFRCVKWLNTAPMYLDDDRGLRSAALMASFIKESSADLEAFTKFSSAIEFIVGEEDNLSMTNLVQTLTDVQAKAPSAFADQKSLAEIRKQLMSREAARIRPAAGDTTTAKELSRPAILFTAGRYTFDGEILSRLIHILRPDPKRPFPKGLDVFATFGNKEAENILMNVYKEGDHWRAYPDSLQKLKAQFQSYADWNKNIYSKTFETIHTLDNVAVNAPLFMKTPAWQKKELITSLAAWSELKHDMLLYAKEPNGAEAGEGGGPPPPVHLSYVEPNIQFWRKAVELLGFEQQTLARMDLLPTVTGQLGDRLIDIGNFLLGISQKELAHEEVTKEEFDRMSWMGGEIESLTFQILGVEILPERDRMVAVVADVYSYNGAYLEEATGPVDDIYVIAEINGRPYLTKGAVFSYYEFTNNTPMTDEEWQSKVSRGESIQRPVWVKEITVQSPSLESKPEYSFLGD